MKENELSYATGQYINVYDMNGQRSVYIIINEPNSVPTVEESTQMIETLERILENGMETTKEELRKQIETVFNDLENDLGCLEFGYQVIVFSGKEK